MSEQDIRKEGEKWILETKVSGIEGVGRFVIGLAAEIQIIDAPELSLYIKQFVVNHLQNYQNS